MPTELDFDGLASYLLARIRDLLPRWLPGGRMQGQEFVCASLQGGAGGDSCKVNTATGLWADFATWEKGGDMISLYAAINRLKQGEAAKALATDVNFNLAPGQGSTQMAPAKPKKAVGVLKTPPEGTKPPVFGEAAGIWCYRTDKGQPIFYIARYEKMVAGETIKNIIPYSWDGTQWQQKHVPAPRPLYNLDQLAEHPDWPVLVVEGEKCAKAAMQIVGDGYVVTTWPGGSNSDAHANFKPLHGRDVVLWPDADSRQRYPKSHPTAPEVRKPYNEQPGPAVMDRIARSLAPYCPKVRIINVKDLYDQDADGWDAADALKAGWTWEEFSAWAKPRLEDFKLPLPAQAGRGELVQSKAESYPQGGPAVTVLEDGVAIEMSVRALWQRAGIKVLQSGNPLTNMDNLLRILAAAGDVKVWFDDFHKRIFTTWQTGVQHEWSDDDTLDLMLRFQRDFVFVKVTAEMVLQAVQYFAKRNRKHEPRDWLKGLIWDGKHRIANFFHDYMKAADNTYTKSASQNFWVSLIARIQVPGCKVDNMVILEGREGIRKSSALAVIGGPWYSEMMIDLNNLAGFLEVLPGKLIIEISEMDAFKKADATAIKKVITNQVDRYRPPYGRQAEDFPRQCIFVGTTNESEYLRDMTGNRRFWPISVDTVNTDAITRDRDQLFAEAKYLFDNDVKWYFMPEEATKEMQESRRERDPWEDAIEEFLVNTNTTKQQFIAEEVLHLMVSKMTWQESRRITKIMKKLGWVTKVGRDANERVERYWERIAQKNLLGN